MPRMLKALLIDPEKREIREVECEKKLEAYYAMMDCTIISIPFQLRRGDSVVCDDEGLFKEPEKLHFFSIEALTPQPLAGKTLIFGTTRTGNFGDVKTSLEELMNLVKFISREEAQQGFKNTKKAFADYKRIVEARSPGIAVIDASFDPFED
jgi:hypothetical protein